MLSLNPQHRPLVLSIGNVEAVDLLSFLQHLAEISIAVIIIVKISHVMVSVRCQEGLMEDKRAATIKKLVYVLAFIFLAVVSILELVLVRGDPGVEDRFKAQSYISIATYCLLLISYIVTLAFLYRTLSKISELGEFKQIKYSVLSQFSVFMVAYLFKLISDTLFLIVDY